MRKQHGFPQQGLLLIVMVGILTLLLMTAVLFVSLTRLERRNAVTGSEQARATLLARSGLEFAVARLLDTPLPGSAGVPPASSDPSDDWRYRDEASTSLEHSLNPSYHAGEPWNDAPTENGRYDPGLDAWDPQTQDLDGSGRYSAWSGRLRGTHSSYSDRFKLRIEDPSGKISVNGNGTGLKGEPLTKDWNGNGEWDPAEPLTDRPQRIEKEGGRFYGGPSTVAGSWVKTRMCTAIGNPPTASGTRGKGMGNGAAGSSGTSSPAPIIRIPIWRSERPL